MIRWGAKARRDKAADQMTWEASKKAVQSRLDEIEKRIGDKDEIVIESHELWMLIAMSRSSIDFTESAIRQRKRIDRLGLQFYAIAAIFAVIMAVQVAELALLWGRG